MPNIMLSTSDIRTFKSCRLKWHFASPLQNFRVPKKSRMPFLRGRAWHGALAEWYSDPNKNMEELAAYSILKEFEADKAKGAEWSDEEISEQVILGTKVLGMYPHWSMLNDKFTILPEWTERREYIPLYGSDNVDFGFRTDQVVRDNESGRLWIHDFKTTSSLPLDSSHLENDEQITGYVMGVEQVLKEKVYGAIFTYLLTKEPAEPTLLQNGSGLSQDKRKLIPPQIFRDAIRDYGFEFADYVNHLHYLESRVSWFRRFVIGRSNDQKNFIYSSLCELAKEMTNDNLIIYPCPSQMNCGSCAYREPCGLYTSNRISAAYSFLDLHYAKGQIW